MENNGRISEEVIKAVETPVQQEPIVTEPTPHEKTAMYLKGNINTLLQMHQQREMNLAQAQKAVKNHSDALIEIKGRIAALQGTLKDLFPEDWKIGRAHV